MLGQAKIIYLDQSQVVMLGQPKIIYLDQSQVVNSVCLPFLPNICSMSKSGGSNRNYSACHCSPRQHLCTLSVHRKIGLWKSAS